MSRRIYLDYAAATPMDPEVLQAMKPYFSDKFYNPSATYLAGRAVRQDLEKARRNVASWLGVRPGEIFFTAGATEANNLAISGIMDQFSDGEILVSAIEHDSVLIPASLFNCNYVAVNEQGIVDLEALKKAVNDKTVLISIMLVNNELGTLQPIQEMATVVSEVRKERLKSGNKKPLYLHTDAAQAGNLLDLHVSRLGADMMSINGGKIYGPKQSGALFVRAGVVLTPLIVGGGQERNMRSGTENVAGIVGLSAALDIAQKKRKQELLRLKKIRELFVSMLSKEIPAAVVNGSSKHQAPHILHVTLPGYDNERLMMQLDEEGVECAVGSACKASSVEPSHVLDALGLSEELARSSLRFSFGRDTKEEDIVRTVQLLKGIII